MKRSIWILAVLTCLRYTAWTGIENELAMAQAPGTDSYKTERLRMVEAQIRKRGVRDERVLAVMEKVPRHLFVRAGDEAWAYHDSPLAIGYDQTISQPYIVAYMTQALELQPTDVVLEIGTGSGYQTAVLAELAGRVFTIEIVEPLGLQAKDRLAALGYANVDVRIGDGYKGWPEAAPFDAIMVTAAPDTVPRALIDQLADGGRMVIPVGTDHQELYVLEKKDGKIVQMKIANVRFVPMVSDPEE
ncbi:MAG: protein-L-isoaspartate(D-aspartate) O-methyltransferase [Candidatus Krumholzibacteriia bacterium]